jgi:hypothetical protein
MAAEDGAVLDHAGLFVPAMAQAGRAMERRGFALTPLETGELAPTATAGRPISGCLASAFTP